MTNIFDDYFGGCPKCGASHGIANVGRGHWGYCSEHRAKWSIGSNLFSSWRLQTEDEQRAIYNEIGLGDFYEVEPLHTLTAEHNPIAGDPGSYVSHDEWLAEVLAKRDSPRRHQASHPAWARRDKSSVPFRESIKRIKQFHGVDASACNDAQVWLQHGGTPDGCQIWRDSHGEFQSTYYDNPPDGHGWIAICSFKNPNEPHTLWARLRKYGDGLGS